MEFEDQLLAVFCHLCPSCIIECGNLGDGICTALCHGIPGGLILQVTGVKAEAGLTIDDHLRASHDAAGNARCLHGKCLEQDVWQAFQEGWHSYHIAALENEEGLFCELVHRNVLFQLQGLDHLHDLTLKFTFSNHQNVDVWDLPGVDALPGCLQEDLLALHWNEAPDASDHKLAVRNRVPLLRLHSHLGCALESSCISPVVDGLDELTVDLEVVHDELSRVLCDGDGAALRGRSLQQGAAVELGFVGGIGRAGLGNEEGLEASLLDAGADEADILILVSLLAHQCHADLCRLEQLGEGLTTGFGVCRALLMRVLHDRGAVSLTIGNDL
mmetsp:Transcript_73127/g.117920  ORF Transcript_73127/g.117920 Transcript_73127/m.117920 type:complete len:329 (+) Transcript_73127:419-1405(+)